MPNAKKVTIDPALPIELNVVVRSPHVAAYRLWCREPGGDWQAVADGHTADDVPDFHRFGPVPAGTGFAYWLGVGGNPNTRYRVIVTVGQGGRILEHGTCVEEGSTTTDGIAAAEGEVRLV